jgi:hypothetical protein
VSGIALLIPILMSVIAIAGVADDSGAAEGYPPEWDALDGTGLVDLARQLAEQGESGHEARAQLSAFVASKFLTDSETARQLTIRHWRGITEHLRGDMVDATRALWADRIRGAYASGPEQVLPYDAQTFADIARTLGSHLGDGKIASLAVTWLDAKDTWKVLNAFELDWLSCLAWQAGGRGNPARQRLADHLTGAYFADPGKVQKAGVTCWYWFTFYLGGALSNETRDVWATRLFEAFAGSPEAVAHLTADEAKRLKETIGSLCADLPPETRKTWFDRLQGAFAKNDESLSGMPGDEVRSLADSLAGLSPKQAGDLVLKWFAIRADWRTAAGGNLARLAYIAAQGDEKATAPLMDGLEQAWLAAEGSQPLDLSSIYEIAQTWTLVGPADKAKAWVTRAYDARVGTEAARSTIDLVSLGRLADFMKMVGLTGPGRGYPGFAAALARHAREGTLEEGLAKYAPRTYWAPCDPALLALPLGTPETRQTLRGELVDAQGNPRIGAAKVLAVAYQGGSEWNDWLALVEQKLKDTQNDPDARSRWLLVRAYTEAARSSPPSPLRGRKWLEEAMASSSVRGQALREIVDGHLLYRRYDQALAVLETLGRRFTDAETVETIAALQAKVKGAKAQAALDAEQAQANSAALHKEELKRRLATARARGDTEAIQRYERLLGNGR